MYIEEANDGGGDNANAMDVDEENMGDGVNCAGVFPPLKMTRIATTIMIQPILIIGVIPRMMKKRKKKSRRMKLPLPLLLMSRQTKLNQINCELIVKERIMRLCTIC